MEQIIDIAIKILAMLLALGIGYSGKYLIAFVKSKMDDRDAEKLDLFVSELVAAAEQLYADADEDGSVRRSYVQEMLVEAGYEITEVVKALIESKVYDINIMNKSVKVGELE